MALKALNSLPVLLKGHWGVGAKFFTVVQGRLEKDNGHKLQWGRFSLGITSKFSSWGQWGSRAGCPRTLCYFCLWRRHWLDQAVSSLVWLQSWSLFDGVALYTSWGAFLFQLSCDFYDHSNTEDSGRCSLLFLLWIAEIILHMSENPIRDAKVVTH